MKTLSKISCLVLLSILFFNGCKKDLVVKNATPLPDKVTHAGSIPDSMVLTPMGLMLKSQVHLVEPGYQLELRGSHMLKVKIGTGELKADFGSVRFDSPSQSPTVNQRGSQANPAAQASNLAVTQTNSSGWKTYSEWNAGSGVPIGTFSTKWDVPANPGTTTPQIVYIGDGISSAQYTPTGNPLVIQPILEWGNNGITGTGASWTISSWCCWSGGAAYTTPVATTAASHLQGVITLTAQQTGGSYNYTSAFSGITGTSLTVVAGTLNGAGNSVTFPTIPVMSWAYETLQGYSVSSVGQYSGTFPIQMTNISLQTGLPGSFITPSPFSWTAKTATGATLGESTTVVSNNVTGTGEVDFYSHYKAPSITYPSGSVTLNTCGAMTPLTPTNTGGAGVTYTVSPALPASLSINSSTGVISGTPGAAAGATAYVITATNNGGVSHFTITITITGPTTISYPATEVYNDGTAITAVSPTIGGTVPNHYTISPALPAGLSISSTTGVISGTPTAPTTPTTYTITGTNGSCSGQGTINIATCFAFKVDNASSMGLSISFRMNSNSQQYAAGVVPAGNTNYTFWMPPGNYYVITNNAGSGVYQLYMDFQTLGPEEILVTNGYTFTSVDINTTNNTFFLRNH
ncbi:MAG: putative Ig domain-containing protein [Sphingobacteriales bacterium]